MLKYFKTSREYEVVFDVSSLLYFQLQKILEATLAEKTEVQDKDEGLAAVKDDLEIAIHCGIWED